MKCDNLLKMLNDYVDGDIDPGICADLEEHLEHCDPCSVVVDNIRNTIKLCQDEEVIYEIPLRFREELHDSLRRKWTDTHPDDDGAAG